jgi:uncharacterized membrane protein YidH (DUF202 family)
MNAHQATSEHKVKPSILPQMGNHFSWLRTRLSIERTLMSWVRTAAAFIGLGFTIFQFFERFNQMSSVGPPISPITLALLVWRSSRSARSPCSWRLDSTGR